MYIQPSNQWIPGVISAGVKCGRNVILTIYHHLVVRLKADSHLATRPDIDTTGNIVTVTVNGPVHIQRQRHDSDNRQILKDFRAVEHSQSVAVFSLFKADHVFPCRKPIIFL
jgi:hypothetical protein